MQRNLFDFRPQQRGMIASMVCAIGLLVSTAEARNLTFLVTSDLHIGAPESDNLTNLRAMNKIGATAAPSVPRGVLIAGDLTQEGRAAEWETFARYYPVKGGTGKDVIHYPVYECTGNHDRMKDAAPLAEVKKRHGSRTYSWDWDGVHFVSLDYYPSLDRSNWLAKNLANVATTTPVVLLFHLGFDKGYSQTFWPNWLAESRHFKQVIENHNIVAIIHGHVHLAAHYQWEGYDVYSLGSPKRVGTQNGFAMVNITDDALNWTNYHWTAKGDITPHATYLKNITSPTPQSGMPGGMDEWCASQRNDREQTTH